MKKNGKSKDTKEQLIQAYADKLNEESSTDSEIEYVEKPKKERKPYILTDKRKEQFDKARQKRQQNIMQKKIESELNNKNFLMLKANLEKKKKEKLLKKQQNEIAKLALETGNISDEEQIIIKKKPKKKVIVVESDSDNEIIYKKKPKEQIQCPPARPTRQIRYL
jgi:hypothetical protein